MTRPTTLSTPTVAHNTTYAAGRGSCSRRSSRATTARPARANGLPMPRSRSSGTRGETAVIASSPPPSPGRGPRVRSRRRVPRSRCTRRTTRTRARATRRRPARAMRARGPDRFGHVTDRLDGGGGRGERGRDLGPGLPERDDAPQARRLRREHREIESLVAATGEQHDRIERRNRAPRGIGVGGLGVVVPAHTPSFAHQSHAMGHGRVRRGAWPGFRRSSRRPRSRPRPR